MLGAVTSTPMSATRRGGLPWVAVAVGLVLVVGTTACPEDPRARARKPVAMVGKAPIRQQALLAVLAQRGVARVADVTQREGAATAILEQLIEEKLLLQAAEAAGIAIPDDAVEREVRTRTQGYAPGTFLRVLGAEQLTLEAFREGIRRRLQQDAFLRSRLAELPGLTDADIEARYQRDWAEKLRPAQVRARQVLLRSAEEARHVYEQVGARKLTMEQAAQRFSQGLEAPLGGDLGWFARGELPEVFEICFNLEVGQVSDVTPSDYGFHVFQVVDTRPERIEPLEVVRDQIIEEMTRERQTAATEALLVELRKKTKVSIARDGIRAVVALLPEAPVTPAEVFEQGTGQALDSHFDVINPIPPLKRDP